MHFPQVCPCNLKRGGGGGGGAFGEQHILHMSRSYCEFVNVLMTSVLLPHSYYAIIIGKHKEWGYHLRPKSLEMNEH